NKRTYVICYVRIQTLPIFQHFYCHYTAGVRASFLSATLFCQYTTTILATFLSANRFYRYSPTAL
ncbi:MAG: hypothetical protein WAM95_07160, partial [Bacillus sp. (in: firmicutes)]